MKIEEIWNTQTAKEVDFELSAKRHKKSINLVSKITKRLKLERTTTYLAAPVMVVFTIVNESYLLTGLVGLYVFGLIVYYNLILRRMESVDVEDSVVNYLRHTLFVLRRFRLHYLLLGLVSFALGFALTFQITEIGFLFETKWIVVVLATMIGTPLLTFYLHYEPHLKKIRLTVEGLQETNKLEV